jgi:prepilin-type N-terminal cleavage/methylation domain-containing protein
MPTKRSIARKNQTGFTLVELMIVVVIAAILAAIAVPNFRSFIQAQRVKSAAADLHASFTLARSEAVKRATAVSVNQVASGWINGWQIPDPTAVGVFIEDHPAVTDVTISAAPGSVAAVPYLPDGHTSADPSTLFTISATDTTTRRCIQFSLRGPTTITPC